MNRTPVGTIASSFFLAAWLASLLLAPACYAAPSWPHLLDLHLEWGLAPVVALLLLRLVFELVSGRGQRAQPAWALVISVALLFLGLLGCAFSLGCQPLEIAWPAGGSYRPFYEAGAVPARWKLFGLWLMPVGVLGGLLCRVTSKLPLPINEPDAG